MAVESNQSDLAEDTAKPSSKSWFKTRARKGHALSYSAGIFAAGIVIFALGVLVGLAASELFLDNAVISMR